MFRGIASRFILIYIVLICICMALVGAFLTYRLESNQVAELLADMSQTMDALAISGQTYFSSDIGKSEAQVKELVSSWRLPPGQGLAVIVPGEVPTILATTSSEESGVGKSALSASAFAPDLVLEALEGRVAKGVTGERTEASRQHLAKPLYSSDGDVVGALYMSASLDSVNRLLQDTRRLLTYATLFGLGVTVALGVFLAGTITGPIREVTRKAEEMAKGNYRQKVDIKSEDEIGRLGRSFNTLTQELAHTIGQMDLERNKLDAIFTYMAEGLVALDRRGHLVHANPIAREILSISEEDVAAKRLFDLESLAMNHLNYHDPASLTGESRVNLGENFYNVKYAPYKDDSGDAGVILVFQDVTKEHRLDVMRKEFVANVSHELKTPLTTIKTYTETLLDPDLPPAPRERFLRIIAREGDRMTHLVRDLLYLSNMDRKREVKDLGPIDVKRAVRHALEGVEAMRKEKGHTIALSLAKDIAPIRGEHNDVERVLTNILTNAIKYTPDFGTISIQGKNYANRVIITVEDTGIGIPPEDINRIFERFYRVEKGRSRAMGGTGLGLSICQEIMEAMGGRISISSTHGVGTMVRLSFPRGDEQ